jgi:hypothetical protein
MPIPPSATYPRTSETCRPNCQHTSCSLHSYVHVSGQSVLATPFIRSRASGRLGNERIAWDRLPSCAGVGDPAGVFDVLWRLTVAEPSKLFRLKCASHRYTADTNSMHFKRNNPLVCRVSARYNHGSIGSRQVYLARRRVYNHITAHQLLIYRNLNITTNRFKLKVNLYKYCLKWQAE